MIDSFDILEESKSTNWEKRRTRKKNYRKEQNVTRNSLNGLNEISGHIGLIGICQSIIDEFFECWKFHAFPKHFQTIIVVVDILCVNFHFVNLFIVVFRLLGYQKSKNQKNKKSKSKNQNQNQKIKIKKSKSKNQKK